MPWVTTKEIVFQDGKVKKGTKVSRAWKSRDGKGLVCIAVTASKSGRSLKLNVLPGGLVWKDNLGHPPPELLPEPVKGEGPGQFLEKFVLINPQSLKPQIYNGKPQCAQIAKLPIIETYSSPG